ncbi:MAG TPA: type II CAAX endopeptidase family protein [Terriglobia bacterium]|nr:type II CAAX endopeptidase family protein [Terriglobia bacterium]
MNDSDPNTASTSGPQPAVSNSAVTGPGLTSPPASSLIHRFFVGPNGIRAGWRFAIFLLLATTFAFAVQLLLRFVLSGSAGKRINPGLVGQLAGEPLLFLGVLLAALVMGRFERRTLTDYGLPGRGAFGAQFWRGVVWGFLALTVLLLLIKLGHGFDFGTLALSGTKIELWASLWAVSFLFVGFFEEFLFRGYALFTLSTGMGFWPSALLLSAAFGAVHLFNGGEDWAGALAAGLIGLFFCLTLRRTGSLWFAVGLHAAWDYAESFIYGVPDSGQISPGHLLNASFHGPTWLTGGSVGPEGSAFVFVIIAALFIIFAVLYRGVRFPRAAVAGSAGLQPGMPT